MGDYDDFMDSDEREEIVLEVAKYFSEALVKRGWSVKKILEFMDDIELDYLLAATSNPNIEDLGASDFDEAFEEFNERLAEEVEAGARRVK